jgi:hypothetical protein
MVESSRDKPVWTVAKQRALENANLKLGKPASLSVLQLVKEKLD